MLGGCWWPGATGSISSGGSCHNLVFVNATRGKPYFLMTTVHVRHIAVVVGWKTMYWPLTPLKLTSCCLEYALWHWAWLTSPTWCRNPGQLLQSLGERLGSIVACGARCSCVHWPVCGRGVATTSRARDRMGVAVGPRVWLCGRGRRSLLTLVFSRADLRHYGYRTPRGCGRVKPLCVYFPYYHHRRGYMELTACSSSQWMSVAVGPRAWQCGGGRGSGLTLVFSREDLRRYGYRIRLGWGRVKPLCVYFPFYFPGRWYIELTACSSSQWVGVAVDPRAWQCVNFGAFPRGPPSLWVSYTRKYFGGVGVWSPSVYIFHIISDLGTRSQRRAAVSEWAWQAAGPRGFGDCNWDHCEFIIS